MKRLRFLSDDGTFALENPEAVGGLYFPLASETGLKSAISPNLGGDSKLDQESFLLEPVSIENLHNNRSTRNLWVITEDGAWSATGVSAEQEAARFTPEQDTNSLTAGLMWQTVRRQSEKYSLASEITSFVSVRDNVEIMRVRIENTAQTPQTLRCVAAVPIYGRSADNLRDHRHVTSLLHRIRTTDRGVLVKPTMSFDEKGHRANHKVYFVAAGTTPQAFFPTVEGFIGEGGSFTHPGAILENRDGVPAGTAIDGREAMGGIAFESVTLGPGESAEFIVLMGIADSPEAVEALVDAYGTPEKCRDALEATKAHWQEKVNVHTHTGDGDFDRWQRWVAFQPFLRRIYGCSFLPHHDYGRGGRGWRDLWQDCLSLLLMDPDGVRDMIVANFGGVRIDGTNATIIGAGDGNFIADRNGIARVWMDHAFWPLLTVKLYIDQTGDIEMLNAKAPWFKDAQAMRGTEIDERWSEDQGSKQLTRDGKFYESSLLEHLLVQQLTAFQEVGAHNICRLRGADWNDALDMAPENGESVAFTAAYAGNLRDLAGLIRKLAKRTGPSKAELLRELTVLLDDREDDFQDIGKKTDALNTYADTCRHTISGKTISVSWLELAEKLEAKSDWLMRHIRAQEWIDAGDGMGWFNSYYDDHSRRVEGITDEGVRMMLIGQVFAIMSGTAEPGQIEAIVRAADRFLFKPEIGGYRLNTDFHELKFDMGRMFGFAYGEKENGAVFSHMAVMYANALYRRGFVREGWKVLKALADTAMDFETSKIYPGIPEYFSSDGRGLYNYLTGAASWYVMTVLTQAFGVRGEDGDLVLEPKLVLEQFDDAGKAGIDFVFAGKSFSVVYANLTGADYGDYRVGKTYLLRPDRGDMEKLSRTGERVALPRSEIIDLPGTGNRIMVELI